MAHCHSFGRSSADHSTQEPSVPASTDVWPTHLPFVGHPGAVFTPWMIPACALPNIHASTHLALPLFTCAGQGDTSPDEGAGQTYQPTHPLSYRGFTDCHCCGLPSPSTTGGCTPTPGCHACCDPLHASELQRTSHSFTSFHASVSSWIIRQLGPVPRFTVALRDCLVYGSSAY